MYQELSTQHDYPVYKAIVDFANRDKGKFEAHFQLFVESVGEPEQGSPGAASQTLLTEVK